TAERLPRGRPLWDGWQAVGLEDPRDRRATDPMAHVHQRALDPCVAPGGILFRHPDDQPFDFRENAATSRTRRVRPFPRDELPMPAQNGVGRDDRRDRTEAPMASPMPVDGQPTTFFIGEAD